LGRGLFESNIVLHLITLFTGQCPKPNN